MTRFRLLTISFTLLLVACLGYLAVDNVLQNRIHKSLINQIEVDRQRLSAIPPAETGLIQELSQAKSDNQRALAIATSVPKSSTEVINALLKLADQYKLAISPVNTESWTMLSLSSAVYKIQPIELEIQGSLPDLIALVLKLEDVSTYPYLIIQELVVDDSLTLANKNDAETVISAVLKLALIQHIPSQNQGETK